MTATALEYDAPAVNLLPAMLVERLGRVVLALCGQELPVPALVRARPGLRKLLGRRIVVGIRPEHLEDALVGLPAATVTAAVLHGRVRQIREVDGGRVVHLQLADADGPTLVARVSERSSGGVGESIMLAVDTRHLLAIDESGRRLW
jgi:ABC-type sugar transport system ATPase subunit